MINCPEINPLSLLLMTSLLSSENKGRGNCKESLFSPRHYYFCSSIIFFRSLHILSTVLQQPTTDQGKLNTTCFPCYLGFAGEILNIIETDPDKRNNKKIWNLVDQPMTNLFNRSRDCWSDIENIKDVYSVLWVVVVIDIKIIYDSWCNCYVHRTIILSEAVKQQ